MDDTSPEPRAAPARLGAERDSTVSAAARSPASSAEDVGRSANVSLMRDIAAWRAQLADMYARQQALRREQRSLENHTGDLEHRVYVAERTLARAQNSVRGQAAQHIHSSSGAPPVELNTMPRASKAPTVGARSLAAASSAEAAGHTMPKVAQTSAGSAVDEIHPVLPSSARRQLEKPAPSSRDAAKRNGVQRGLAPPLKLVPSVTPKKPPKAPAAAAAAQQPATARAGPAWVGHSLHPLEQDFLADGDGDEPVVTLHHRKRRKVPKSAPSSGAAGAASQAAAPATPPGIWDIWPLPPDSE